MFAAAIVYTGADAVAQRQCTVLHFCSSVVMRKGCEQMSPYTLRPRLLECCMYKGLVPEVELPKRGLSIKEYSLNKIKIDFAMNLDWGHPAIPTTSLGVFVHRR